jgi:hypothetical protein
VLPPAFIVHLADRATDNRTITSVNRACRLTSQRSSRSGSFAPRGVSRTAEAFSSADFNSSGRTTVTAA